MRILKKSLALVLAIAMMASLIVVNVSAEGEDIIISIEADKAAVGQGNDVQLTVYYTTAANVTTGNNGFTISYPSSVTFKSDDSTGLYYDPEGAAGSLHIEASKMISIGGTTGTFNAGKTAVAKFTFTVNADASVSDPVTFTVANYADSFSTGAGDPITVGLGATPSITVLKAFTVTTVTPGATAINNVAMGTALADIEAQLAAIDYTVAGAGGAEAGEEATLNVATWTSAPAYNKDKPGTYTFSGELAGTDVITVPADKKAVSVAVTVIPFATATEINVTLDETKLEIKQGEILDAAALVALAKEAVTKIEFANASYTGAVAVAENGVEFATSDALDGTENVDDTKTVTITFTDSDATDADGAVIFNDIDGTKTVTFTVVPAEIAGGSIAVKGQRATATPEVTAVIPADGIAAGTYDVVVNFYAVKGDGTPDYDALAKDAITVADVVVTAGQATTITATATKNLKDMGFDEVGEEFAAEVLVDGAALLVEGVAYIKDKVVASTSGSAAGIGTPSVPAKPQTPVEKPEEPGTEEPGTEEPGTEEPGTEEPGTEEPGTEEPGTEEPGTEEPATGFEDVTAEFDWAAESINKLADLGVINGKGDNKFAPNADITRAEFTKMIVTLLGLEAAATETAFADCAADDWFTPYIIAATEAGVIKGVADDAFAPNDTITREQACTILGRALALVGEADVAFTDATEISDYAAEFVAALAELGIINGYEDGSFAPANNITRAEAAKILAGALDIIAPVEDAPVEEAPAEEVVEEVVAE